MKIKLFNSTSCQLLDFIVNVQLVSNASKNIYVAINSRVYFKNNVSSAQTSVLKKTRYQNK